MHTLERARIALFLRLWMWFLPPHFILIFQARPHSVLVLSGGVYFDRDTLFHIRPRRTIKVAPFAFGAESLNANFQFQFEYIYIFIFYLRRILVTIGIIIILSFFLFFFTFTYFQKPLIVGLQRKKNLFHPQHVKDEYFVINSIILTTYLL